MKAWKKNMASSSDSSSSLNSWLSRNSDEDPLPDVSFLTNCSLLDFMKTKLEPEEEPEPTYKSPFIVRVEVSSEEQSSDLHSDEITIEKVPDDYYDERLLSDSEEKPNADSSERTLSPGKRESGTSEMVSETLTSIKLEPNSDSEDAKYESNHPYSTKELPDDKFLPTEIKKEPSLSPSSFKCEICHKTYSKLSYLVCHIKTHSRPKPYKCNVCNRKFPWLSRMINHKKKVHSSEKPYKCGICNRSFNDKYNLTRHEVTHSKRVQCDLCIESFALRSELWEHKRNNHMKLHNCESCDRVFSKRSNFRYHQRTTHELDVRSMNKCEICNQKFHDGVTLQEHKKMWHMTDEKFKCQVCKLGFPNLWSLNKHMAARHTVGFAYGCDLCDRTFYEEGCFTNHMQYHLPKNLSK